MNKNEIKIIFTNSENFTIDLTGIDIGKISKAEFKDRLIISCTNMPPEVFSVITDLINLLGS